MNLLLVTFALRNQLRDYDDFFVAIRGNCFQWWHFIETTYIVVTQHDSSELALRLCSHIEPTDSVLVVPVTQPISGWLPPAAWTWLNEHLTASERNRLLSR